MKRSTRRPPVRLNHNAHIIYHRRPRPDERSIKMKSILTMLERASDEQINGIYLFLLHLIR